ncbi:hypothetical protein C6T65_14050 [Burkholderia vietnamiensis]|uniref:Uncharacterized protein n=1 Tax=Burkholderia vietnamiensis TaxID=60552 RepID=A0AA44Y0G2_BURVI|nr:hypothetical protein C6T65_14050 [Burkholderia vietnamiensis]
MHAGHGARRTAHGTRHTAHGTRHTAHGTRHARCNAPHGAHSTHAKRIQHAKRMRHPTRARPSHTERRAIFAARPAACHQTGNPDESRRARAGRPCRPVRG